MNNRVSKRITLWFIVALSAHIFLSLLIWDNQLNNLARESEWKFTRDMSNDSVMLANRLETYAGILYNLRALISASEYVSKQEWDIFMSSAFILERYPGITGVIYTSKLVKDEIPAFNNKIITEYEGNADILHDYSIFPDHNAENLFITTYTYPTAKSTKVIGFNAGSEERRLAALLKARDSGLAVMTEALTLLSDTDESSFVIYLPIYDIYKPTNTVEERVAGLKGFVSIAFRIDYLLRSFLQIYDQDQGVNLTIFDTSDSEASGIKQIVHIHNPNDFVEEVESIHAFNFGERKLEFVFTADKFYNTNPITLRNTNVFFFALFAGGVVSLGLIYRGYLKNARKQLNL